MQRPHRAGGRALPRRRAGRPAGGALRRRAGAGAAAGRAAGAALGGCRLRGRGTLSVGSSCSASAASADARGPEDAPEPAHHRAARQPRLHGCGRTGCGSARERLRRGDAGGECGLVFPSTVGTPLEPRNLTRATRRCWRAGLPAVRFHDLRHTAPRCCSRAGWRRRRCTGAGDARSRSANDTYTPPDAARSGVRPTCSV